ncbi:hypothetical protein J3L18_29685 [Mucilaginibacter gossypii]|uniref:hypothetical protein n=1 Tax=Mucilaginibacter gossypii TaxID=551996 RepID=UPI000DCEB51F|nr:MULTISPECIES: hypothetical protein [Mucilaginibacter]QTE37230.1 hypothetical protein J3L18_29685 [Mucilaginibacter gossypii]RAV57191.1 hypothetical protein DIU36_12765 [Mucilaginibacter rubeus]
MPTILKAIGGFFASLLKKLTGNNNVAVQLPADLPITTAEIDLVINVVNKVKSVVNNPIIGLIIDFTPTGIDNAVRDKINQAIPALLTGLTFSKGVLGADGQPQQITDLLNKIKFSDDPDKDGLYHVLAARLIVVVSDGKITWSEAVSVIELYFKQIFITQ